ncbi:MAG TPA: DUF881 domain-containing protein [Micromonosporaceae bacterium]|jgi:uncharacterized protein YlxW (UPF0749 family)
MSTANPPNPPNPDGDGRRRVFAPDFLTELFRNPLDPAYADAAARRRERGPAPGGWRAPLTRAITAVTLAAIGLLFVVAYRHALADEPSRSQARAGLVTQINDRRTSTERLRSQADGLREDVARLRDAALDQTEATRLREMEAATGLAKVHGDGVVVRLGDAPTAVDAVTGQRNGESLGRVLDRDLQDVANALWASGAEAISINGQRLTSTSTVRTAGGAILVDFQPVTSPYDVTAIGPDDLGGRFAGTDAARLFRALAGQYGMTFQLRDANNVTLPAAIAPQLRYAAPATSETPGPNASQPTPSTTPSGGGR